MVSRLLHALDARIARTRDPVQADCLRAERATLLARQGHLEQAQAQLELIRARHAARPNAVVTAWVCLGEGIATYFRNLDPRARDRLLRALALGEAAQADQVVALSSAWLAQLDFAALSFDELLVHLPHALKHAKPDHHAALCRASLVAAEAFHWAERIDLALPWYARSRQHATTEGDESMLSALMHNMAWLKVTEYRRQRLCGESSREAAQQARLGADSTSRYDELVGIASLDSLVPMLRAQVMILDDEFEAALTILDANAQAFIDQGMQRLACAVGADIAWCHLKCGHTEEAQQAAERAAALVSPITHADDLALTFTRLSGVWRELGDAELANRFELAATEAWQGHRLQQAKLVPLLESALDGL